MGAARRGNYGKRIVFGAAGAGIMENVLFLKPPSAGIMENVMFLSSQIQYTIKRTGVHRNLWYFREAKRGNDGKRIVVGAARSGNDGKRRVLGAAGAGIMENVLFLKPPGAGMMENVLFLSSTLENTIKRTGGHRIPWYSSSQKRFGNSQARE